MLDNDHDDYDCDDYDYQETATAPLWLLPYLLLRPNHITPSRPPDSDCCNYDEEDTYDEPMGSLPLPLLPPPPPIYHNTPNTCYDTSDSVCVYMRLPMR